MKRTNLLVLMIILMSIASGTSLYAQDATGVRRNLERMYGKVETIGIECYLVEHANKQGVFDKYGKEIVPFNGDYWEIKWNSKSKCFEATSHKKDSKGDLLAAVYNQKGGVVVPPGGYMLKYKDDSSPFDSYEVSAKLMINGPMVTTTLKARCFYHLSNTSTSQLSMTI